MASQPDSVTALIEYLEAAGFQLVRESRGGMGGVDLIYTGAFDRVPTAVEITGGLANPNPTLNQLTALKDNPPLVQFVRPDRPALKAPANAKVPLRIKASDDFGVREATLYVAEKDGAKINVVQPPRNYLERKDPVREFTQDETIDLGALRAKPGAIFEYWMVVRDTREPHSNKVETGHQTIEATQPASQKDLQAIEKPKEADEPKKGDDPDEEDARPNNAPEDKADEPQKGNEGAAKGRDAADDPSQARRPQGQRPEERRPRRQRR